MASLYDDDLWRRVPDDAGPPPAELVGFVEGLGHAGSALDLGCGDGRLTLALDADELTVADVSAVALERASVRLGKSRAERGVAPAVAVELDPDAVLPLPDNAFDVVVCAETIEHVRDLQLLLSEARRVLRPGGRLAVTTPAHSRLTGLDVLARGFDRRFPPLSPHLRFLTRRSLRDLLEDLGFEPGPIRRRGGSLLAVARR
ncbi:MAG TPA: methyltransferase domain-containing protein [Solirubrobacteraceae bacterium]|nr:methyltransferase domain-containing protein [Solirubrobacteraceae bacterium]